jgi:hypothetical protein
MRAGVNLLHLSRIPLIRSSTTYVLSRLITTFRTATEKHATKNVEITLKNTKMISIFQRIVPQNFLTF